MVNLIEIFKNLPDVFFIGGCVRDTLLGIKFKDIDLTTSAFPYEIENIFPNNYKIGPKFGTIIIRTEDYGDVEITTMRKNINGDSIVFGNDIVVDLSMRDFTINAIALDLSGKLLDPFNGISDLKNRILRTPKDAFETLNDDPIRALRAIYFKMKYGFKFDQRLETAIKATALYDVSSERIYTELTKLFEIDSCWALNLLKEYGLLVQFLPEIDMMDQFDQRQDKHPEGSVWNHTLICMSYLNSSDPMLLKMCVLLHDVGKPAAFLNGKYHGHDVAGESIASVIMQRFSRSRMEIACVRFVVKNHMKVVHFEEMRTAKQIELCTSPYIEYLVVTHEADCLGRSRLPSTDFIYDLITKLSTQLEPLLTGHDLINLGISPGPIFGEIKSAVEAARVDGILHTADEARLWVKEKYIDARTNI